MTPTTRIDSLVDAFVREVRSVSRGESLTELHTLGDKARALMTNAESPSPAAIDALVAALGEFALHTDRGYSQLGQQLLFGSIIECLADSFDADKAALYDRIFTGVIDLCRRREAGRPLDALLSRFGLIGADDLRARKQDHANRDPFPVAERSRIKRVFVPSRVTVGADVAVTSIVLQKIERIFPEAEYVIVGPAAARETLANTVKRLRFVTCPYPRRGTLTDRLEAWRILVDLVHADMALLEPDACLLIDPDSRLTQLGLLPIVPSDAPSFFFESRTYRRPGIDTLGALTGHWLDEVLGPDDGETIYPRVTPATSELSAALAVVRRVRGDGARDVTMVNLGVGGNDIKRIAGSFELDLVRAILAEGSVVILDKGIDDEVSRAEAILAALAAQGIRITELDTGTLGLRGQDAGQVLTYQGGLRPLIALIAASDLYVGYDSACQHIAAALAVPTIDIFVTPPSERFTKRWQPHSKASVGVISAKAGTDDADAMFCVLSAYRRLRDSRA